MKHQPKSQFAGDQTDGAALSMKEAIAEAKVAVTDMTGLGIDSVSFCARSEDLTWRVAVDVIECVARMGDNDLLATYEVQIAPDRTLLQFSRLRRYHREDKDNS